MVDPTRVSTYLGGTGQNNVSKINVHATENRVAIGAFINPKANLEVRGNLFANKGEFQSVVLSNAVFSNLIVGNLGQLYPNADIQISKASGSNATFNVYTVAGNSVMVMQSSTNKAEFILSPTLPTAPANLSLILSGTAENVFVRANTFIVGRGTALIYDPSTLVGEGLVVIKNSSSSDIVQAWNTVLTGTTRRVWGVGLNRVTSGDWSLMVSASANTIPSIDVITAKKEGMVGILNNNPSANLSVTGNAFITTNLMVNNEVIIGSGALTYDPSTLTTGDGLVIVGTASGKVLQSWVTNSGGTTRRVWGVLTEDTQAGDFSLSVSPAANTIPSVTVFNITRDGRVRLGANVAGTSATANLEIAGNVFATANIVSAGVLKSYTSTAVGAGANNQAFVIASNVVNQFGIFYGTGAPTFGAGKGSIYTRTDATTTTTRLYVNTDGSTTWATITTSA